MRYLLTLLLICISFALIAQKIRGKACGSCGKPVSVQSKIGDICPHCGVKWGSENATSGKSKVRTHNTLSEKQLAKKKQKAISFSNFNKKQLVEYLENKLNKYAKDQIICSSLNDSLIDAGCNNYLNYEIKIDSIFLTVKCSFNNKYFQVAHFPLYDFGCITHTMPSAIGISAKTHVAYPSENELHEYLTSYISLGFDKKAEENLTHNMEAAFIAISKYFQKPSNQY